MTSSSRKWLVTCIGWGIGTAGIAVLSFSRTLILRFMTDFLEIAAVVAGLLFAFSKLFDAVTDPLMGAISDKTNSKWGRRRPYLLVGALLCGISYVLLFNIPSVESSVSLVAYLAAVLMFYAIAYTVFNVPYLAMPVEMTPDYHDRSFLVSFRAIGAGVGNLLGGVLGPIILAAYGGGVVGHRVMSWVLGGITFALLLISFAMTSNAPFSRPPPKSDTPVVETLSSVFRNRPYVVLLMAKGLFFVAVTVLTTSSAYFTTHVLASPDSVLALFFGAFFIGVAVSQPLWLKASRRLDKPATYTIACILTAMVNLTWLAADSMEPKLVFILRSIAVGLMMGGVIVMGNSMLPDTLEFDSRQNTVQREGLLAGFYTTLEKGGSALGIAIVGLTLGWMGYVESAADERVQQPQQTVDAIRICFAVVPATALFASGLVMRFYSLRASSFDEVAT